MNELNVLDEEWTRLNLEAKDIGFSIREIPDFIQISGIK